MRHFFLTSGLVCLILLIGGAMDNEALFSSPPGELGFVALSEETSAGKTLDQAMAALAPDRVLWLEMAVRQRMFGEDAFDTEGRYLLGPDQRARLDLRIMSGGHHSRVLIVSDGSSLRTGRWLDGNEQPAANEDLPPRDAKMNVRQKLLEDHGVGGLVPLLRQIHQSLQSAVQRSGTWHGRPAIQVSGAWNETEDILKELPYNLRARQCRLVLDAESLWPHRIEWLGSPRPLNFPVVLLQMDFRDPVLNRPLSPAECGSAFRFSPR